MNIQSHNWTKRVIETGNYCAGRNFSVLDHMIALFGSNRGFWYKR